MALVAALGACSSGGSGRSSVSTTSPDTRSSSSTPANPSRRPNHAVGVRIETFENAVSPLTAKDGDPPSAPRPLETTIYYPAAGAGGGVPTDDPPPATDGPFPLIVFAHGFSASPPVYAGLTAEWARAGYVVAVPRFPKSNAAAVGGPDAGDYVNQPADLSAVISGMERLSSRPGGALSGLVASGPVGAAGHSLGGITTLGVAANTCCRDRRVGAAVVLSGDPLLFPTGKFDYAQAPPLLLVHGTADSLVAYDAAVDVFNHAWGPKGLLTIRDGDHGSTFVATDASFRTVVRATTAFFDAYLKGAPDAALVVKDAGRSSTTRIVFAAKPGATTTIATEPKVARRLKVSVTPKTGLVSGQMVTVTWSGFTPGNTINIVQCSNRVAGDSSACDLQHGKILQPNPTGSGSLPLEMVVGAVGSGTCDADHADCQIVVNDGGSLDPAASVRISISFAAG